MTTDSEARRYRDSYAAGHRDGSVPSSDEDATEMRRLTGDDSSDDGYAAGFVDGRHDLRRGAFSSVGRLVKDLLCVPDISRWLRRLTGSRTS